MFVWTVDVGSTDRRPVVPDQFVSRVQVAADDAPQAILAAVSMVMRPGVVMATSASVVSVVL